MIKIFVMLIIIQTSLSNNNNVSLKRLILNGNQSFNLNDKNFIINKIDQVLSNKTSNLTIKLSTFKEINETLHENYEITYSRERNFVVIHLIRRLLGNNSQALNNTNHRSAKHKGTQDDEDSNKSQKPSVLLVTCLTIGAIILVILLGYLTYLIYKRDILKKLFRKKEEPYDVNLVDNVPDPNDMCHNM